MLLLPGCPYLQHLPRQSGAVRNACTHLDVAHMDDETDTNSSRNSNWAPPPEKVTKVTVAVAAGGRQAGRLLQAADEGAEGQALQAATGPKAHAREAAHAQAQARHAAQPHLPFGSAALRSDSTCFGICNGNASICGLLHAKALADHLCLETLTERSSRT